MKIKRKLILIGLALLVLMLLCTANAFAEPLPSGYDVSMLSMNNISTSIEHTVAIQTDGSVVSTGDNQVGQGDLSLWNDIVIVRAGPCVTFGIRKDGSTISAGYNTYGPYGEEWNYLKDISLYRFHVVGLRPDGTVIAAGQNTQGQCNTASWSCIKAIAAGGWHTVGLKEDGTVVATGDNSFGQCDVQSWRNIVAIAAGGVHTLGLTSDGTVLSAGENANGQCDVADWTDIVAICAGFAHSVGIKANGTVTAVGYNDTGACEVSGWRNIVAVSANNENTIGLTADGTMLSAGSNLYGQNDFSAWKNIKVGTDTPMTYTGGIQQNRANSADINGPWFYLEDIRTLVIHDESAMKDYTAEGSFKAPWAFLSGQVDNIIIERGITRISDWPFLCLTRLNVGEGVKTIYIPSSVTSIGEGAFEFSIEISDVYYEGTQDDWVRLVGDTDLPILSRATIHCLAEDSMISVDNPLAESINSLSEENPFQNAYVGDTVLFGRYEQDNNLNNGPEEISWLVQERNEERVLVVSEYALDCQPYNKKYSEITWEDCSLRRWLNDTFMNTAFRADEQAIILPVVMNADKNPEHSTAPGRSAEDQVFLLSAKEVKQYFSSDWERSCTSTAYALAQGCKANDGSNTCWWWTRTPGCDHYYVVDVRGDGTINYTGGAADRDYLCVRPALWIDLTI